VWFLRVTLVWRLTANVQNNIVGMCRHLVRGHAISVLNHCLQWYKFADTHLYHCRQWFNIHVSHWYTGLYLCRSERAISGPCYMHHHSWMHAGNCSNSSLLLWVFNVPKRVQFSNICSCEIQILKHNWNSTYRLKGMHVTGAASWVAATTLCWTTSLVLSLAARQSVSLHAHTHEMLAVAGPGVEDTKLHENCLLWSPYVIGPAIIFLPCDFYLLSFFPRLISAVGDGCPPYFHTWCGLNANLRCRSETCCVRLAENTGRKNDAKIAIWAPSHNFVGLYLHN